MGVDSEGQGGGVYVLDDDSTLKHFAGTVDSAYLTALQDFYASLDWSVLSYTLPENQSLAVEGDVCNTVERNFPVIQCRRYFPRSPKHKWMT